MTCCGPRTAYAAWDANDADAFAELYLDDATVMMPGTYGFSVKMWPS